MPTSTTGQSQGWEPPSIEELNQLLPQYEIDAIIGRGGMGAVYKGRQASLQRPVAIKLLPEDLIEDDDDCNYVERFKQEARAMAGLDHPAIISVFDFGQTSEGHLYFVMEFVDGMDIEQYIKASGGTVSPEYTVAIVSHVLDALEYAHSKGIVHRDIKPANVLINQEGRVKIADFGLAKQFGGGADVESIGLTMTDMALGTPDYIAPEALEIGVETDGRADLYSVGVMLYQMLTGKLPRGLFKLPNAMNPELDARFDDIITQALNADRESRYQTAGEFRSKLNELLSSPVTRVEPAQKTGEVSAAVSRLNFPATGAQSAVARKRTAVSHSVPIEKPKKGNGAIIGIAAGCAVSVIIAFFLFRGGKDELTPQVTPVKPAPKKVLAQPNRPPKPKQPPLETKKPPATAPAVAKVATWPKGPNFRSEGRLRAWSSIPNDPVIDLSKLKGIDDIKQIYAHAEGWVVLRENGQTISSDGKADRENIRRICPGWYHHLALITNEGKLQAFHKSAEIGQVEIPQDLGSLKDAYWAPFHRVALSDDGTLTVWGKAYDGIKEKWNPEWKTKPTIPTGRKVLAMSSTDNVIAVKLDDGSLKVWTNGGGELTVPDEFVPGEISGFAIGHHYLVGITAERDAGIFWHYRVPKSPGRKYTLPSEAIDIRSNPYGSLVLTESGTPELAGASRNAEEILAGIESVNSKNVDLISLFAWRTNDSLTARLLWFDTNAPPLPPESLGITAAPKPPPKASPPKPLVEKNATASVPDIPDLKNRLTNYQKLRAKQIGELVTGFRTALKREEEAAVGVGSLSDVTHAETAIKDLDAFVLVSKKEFSTIQVSPLPTLPSLGQTASARLREFRKSFDDRLSKIELELRKKLEQSLQFSESKLTRENKISEARSVRNYRDALAIRFNIPD